MLASLGTPLDYTHDGVSSRQPRQLDQTKICARSIYRDKSVVFLMRDPRDTVVSAYFQKSLRLGGYEGNLSAYLADPVFGVENVIRFNLTWLDRGRALPAFHVVTYEALVADTAKVLRSVGDFLGVELRDTDIARVVGEHAFAKMRERQAQGEVSSSHRQKLLPTDRDNPESYKSRRGKPGGYVDYFSPADLSYCDELLARYRYFETCQVVMPHGASH
jgi:hypothetical protein